MFTSLKNIFLRIRRHYFPFIVILLVVGGVGVFFSLFASTNRTNAPLPYQGRLLDTNYVPVSDGVHYMKFALYTSPTGTGSCIWESGTDTGVNNCNAGSSSSTPVTVSRGQFTMLLGAGGTHNPVLPQGAFSFESNTFYLGVTVCGTNNVCDSQMSPRVQIVGVPYAHNSDLFDGLDSISYAQLSGQSAEQLLIGGTAANNTIVLQANGTSNGNTGTSAVFLFKTGNAGETTAMTTLNNGSIAVGTSTPHASVLFDLVSSLKGFRAPSMTTAQRDTVSNPVAGLLIYNTDAGAYHRYVSSWKPFGLAGGGENRIAFWVASDELSSNANFSWDASTARFGIGTPSPSSTATLAYTGVGSSQGDGYGISINNSTVATINSQKYTPPLVFRGAGWNTGSSANRQVYFRMFGVPVQGNPPTSYFTFEWCNDGVSTGCHGGSSWSYTTSNLLNIFSNGKVALGTASPSISGTGRFHSYSTNTVRLFDTVATPVSTAACNGFEMSFDTDYLYVCTASGAWKRLALSAY